MKDEMKYKIRRKEKDKNIWDEKISQNIRDQLNLGEQSFNSNIISQSIRCLKYFQWEICSGEDGDKEEYGDDNLDGDEDDDRDPVLLLKPT